MPLVEYIMRNVKRKELVVPRDKITKTDAQILKCTYELSSIQVSIRLAH